MAEFQEVMRQLNRLCSHYQNCDESGCPMYDECGNIGEYCSDPKHSYRIEKTVMAWAAEHPEHPEPVYPTWLEWLSVIGVIPKVIDCKTLFLDVYNGVHDHRIPADIAEKLGLQPKEG